MSIAPLFLICLAVYVLLQLLRGARKGWRCTAYLEGMLDHPEIFHGSLYLIHPLPAMPIPSRPAMARRKTMPSAFSTR